MGNIKQKTLSLMNFAQDSFSVIRGAVAENGIGFFKLHIAAAVFISAMLWNFVYKPSLVNYHAKQMEVESLAAQKQYGAQYLEISAQVKKGEDIFPPTAKKEDWLENTIKNICSAEGVVVRSFRAKNEDMSGHYISSSISFTFEASFEKAGKIIAAIESAEKFMKITKMSISKSPNLGAVNAEMTVTTFFPVVAAEAA